MPLHKPITIVQGAQYGSEGKGAIAAHLCKVRGIDYAVRTGATNAGHTVVYKGMKARMQQLPVGWVNPDTRLVIGAGALIDPDVLAREVEEVSAMTGDDVRDRLIIDYRAGLHLPFHAERSAQSDRHTKIGATGKGCSEALIDRIKGRGEGYLTFGRTKFSAGYDVADTELLLNMAVDDGAKILLEGTQGTLLDLYLGPYPYTTHKQTGPAQWMMEAGLSPTLPVDVVLVVRTFPIRVAGNSGPMVGEISWPILARTINNRRRHLGLALLVPEDDICAFEGAVRRERQEFDVPEGSDGLDQHLWSPPEMYAVALSRLNAAAWATLPESTKASLEKLFEMTTVTKKLRRIAHFDTQAIKTAARQCRPTEVVITFMNYMQPEHWYEVPGQVDDLTVVHAVEVVCDAPVSMVTYGPASEHIMEPVGAGYDKVRG